MATMLDDFVRCMRGDLVVSTTADKEAWIDSLANAWMEGYEAARQCEREDSDCRSDTIITLVDTRNNSGKPISTTLESITVIAVSDGVKVTVATHYKEQAMLIDTEHTEVYSKRKYYYSE